MAGEMPLAAGAGARLYTAPSLLLLSAQTAANNLHRLLPRQMDQLAMQSEEHLIMIFVMMMKSLKLTPRIVLTLKELAVEMGHTILLELLSTFDIQAGIFTPGDTACSNNGML